MTLSTERRSGRKHKPPVWRGRENVAAEPNNSPLAQDVSAPPLLWKTFLVAFCAAFIAYIPALSGAFIFDDVALPFANPNAASQPAVFWIGGVRPFLMLSYWANFLLSGTNPLSYHLFNVALHALAVSFVFRCVWVLLRNRVAADSRLPILAAFAAGLFLLHPLQTESVAYIAGRSEVLTGACFYAGFMVFLQTPEGKMSYARAAVVLLLAGLATLSKEHAVVLAPLLLFTAIFWDEKGIRHSLGRYGRLFGALIALALVASALVLKLLRSAATAGPGAGSWQAYFITQWRVVPQYIRLFVLPVGQNGDWGFPFSVSMLSGGAIFWGLGLLAMIVLCFRYRARAPLVSYGILAFLLLLAPTSSVVPIRDAMAERRVYLPIFGLCLAAAAALAYSKLSVRVLKWITLAVLFLAGSLTYARSYVWADELVFWTDVTRKSDQNGRAFQALARALSIRGRYADAIANYEKALTLPADPESRTVVQLSLASTYALNHQPDKARAVLAKMNTSDKGAQLSSQLGVIAAKAGDGATAMRDFDRAIQLAPNLEPAYKYRGLVEESLDRNKEAEADFRRAVSLDSSDTEAAAALRELAARQ